MADTDEKEAIDKSIAIGIKIIRSEAYIKDNVLCARVHFSLYQNDKESLGDFQVDGSLMGDGASWDFHVKTWMENGEPKLTIDFSCPAKREATW